MTAGTDLTAFAAEIDELYERFGFRTAGRRRAYYHDNREDALIMWRTVPERATA